jgi:hypothetical protein
MKLTGVSLWLPMHSIKLISPWLIVDRMATVNLHVTKSNDPINSQWEPGSF